MGAEREFSTHFFIAHMEFDYGIKLPFALYQHNASYTTFVVGACSVSAPSVVERVVITETFVMFPVTETLTPLLVLAFVSTAAVSGAATATAVTLPFCVVTVTVCLLLVLVLVDAFGL